MSSQHPQLYADSLQLLQQLIRTPSLSGQEEGTAQLLADYCTAHGLAPRRHLHNVWCANKHYDPAKPNLLLNSHHDTVKPNAGYTRDPYGAEVADGRLYGLGSNDAGASLVALLAAFRFFYDKDLKYNLIWAGTAEEEISGQNGIAALLPQLGSLDCALVGEPTGMQPAVAEKGLMVLDCTARGRAGHAARDEGVNALYIALDDIHWFRTHRFDKESATLGPVKMTVTGIQCGTQHNVVPDTCTYMVDVRTTDAYTNDETLALIRRAVQSEVVPRSTRLNPSGIAPGHPLVQAALALGRTPYGSPTLSDQALIPYPSLKMGPGESARSHTPDEYILLEELSEGIDLYIALLEKVLR